MIKGTLSCFDRVVISGSLVGVCFAEGMTSFFYAKSLRIFDYAHVMEPLRDDLRANAEKVAKDNGLEIEFIRRARSFRKEERVREILGKRGDAPGLVHIFSAMEECPSFSPWHDKRSGKTYLRPTWARCLHYYFYFVDKVLGLCHLRVPTWAPFRLQFYFNGHNQLASTLREHGIGYQMLDNAFVDVDDFDLAQKLADEMKVRHLHERLDHYARSLCPVIGFFGAGFHWSIDQVEYSTDIIFRSQDALAPIYKQLVETAVHAVKAEHVATFLGRRLTERTSDEIGNDLSTRIEGTRIKHHYGKAAIKMYDKRGIVLRIETTSNDVSFFKHHRTVVHRDPDSKTATEEFKLAPVKKSIYSLWPDLRSIFAGVNRRYLEFLSSLDQPSSGLRALARITEPTDREGRTYKGFNFFSGNDLAIMATLARAEFTIAGVRNADLREHMPDVSSGVISRFIKRLRVHGILKKVAGTYRYYVTALGKCALAAGFVLRNMLLPDALADV
jgi:hypothetical protein